MSIIYVQSATTIFGELLLGSFENKLCLCDWKHRKMRNAIDSRIQHGLQAKFLEENSPVIKKALHQLQEYFAGKRTQFNIELLTVGTDFQKRVWSQLQQIECGKTISYGQLAQEVGNLEAVRAVSNANGANALSIFIPCHRVIGTQGELTGYAGGIDTKRKLLALEGASLNNRNQLQLF